MKNLANHIQLNDIYCVNPLNYVGTNEEFKGKIAQSLYEEILIQIDCLFTVENRIHE